MSLQLHSKDSFRNFTMGIPAFRHCVFLLDELLSCYDCYQFIQPVALTAVVYHAEIKHPMDFRTLELNLYQNTYSNKQAFISDLELIWTNAKLFHRSFDLLYQQADNLCKRYQALEAFVKGGPRPYYLSSSVSDIDYILTTPLPEESFPMYKELAPPSKSNLYFIQGLSDQDHATKKLRGFTQVRLLFQHLNSSFFSLQQTPFPRFYIAKNRTLLNEARLDPDGVLAILCNVQIKPLSRDLYHVHTTVILTEPMSETHGFDQSSVPRADEFNPKAWLKLRILKVVHNVQTVMNADMDRNYFKKIYHTYKLSLNNLDVKKVGDEAMAKEFVKSLLHPVESTASVPVIHAATDKLKKKKVVVKKPVSSQLIATTTTTTTSKPNITNNSGQSTPIGISRSSSPEQDASSLKLRLVLNKDQSWTTDQDEWYNAPTSPAPDPVSFERYMLEDGQKSAVKQYYLDASKELWKKLAQYASDKHVPVVDIARYVNKTSSFPNAEGFFKHVYYLKEDSNKVIQTFRRMTITQRTTEIASLLTLKDQPHMGQITQVLQEAHGELIGLSMQRYQKTLKQYTHAHSHHRLTAYQKMDLVIQMLTCMQTIHKAGLAHRDLSEVNFMVNETKDVLADSSPRAELFLIDFGKSMFVKPQDVRRWWIEHPADNQGEVVPLTKEDLDIWCQQLPWIRSKPDHGYRLYRSVQTLPKSRTDTEDLPWLINPMAEDMYSIGTIIWKIFSETEPWHGILDTDLKGLRETVSDDYQIESALQREVTGELSKQLLLKVLKVSPDQRASATEVLEWLDAARQQGLIKEWEAHAPVGRQKRHAKAQFRYEEEDAQKKQKINHSTP